MQLRLEIFGVNRQGLHDMTRGLPKEGSCEGCRESLDCWVGIGFIYLFVFGVVMF